jgi:hypothetical protein
MICISHEVPSYEISQTADLLPLIQMFFFQSERPCFTPIVANILQRSFAVHLRLKAVSIMIGRSKPVFWKWPVFNP